MRGVFTPDTDWRNRSEFMKGREQVDEAEGIVF